MPHHRDSVQGQKGIARKGEMDMGQKGQGQAAHPSHVEPEVGSRAVESLKFFVDRGQSQTIAGYYDVDDLTNFQQRDAAARQVKGVAGFMYTTWQAKYGLLERYGKAIGAASNP
jgi:hypothetical protein